MTEMMKEYIGDAVYVHHDGFHIWLTTGDENQQRIALDPSVFAQLLSWHERFRVRMVDMPACIAALESAKMPTPDKPGDSYEVLGVMFCGTGDFQRHYNKHWWQDPVGKP